MTTLVNSDDLYLGATDHSPRAGWLMPVLMGIAAPLLIGLVLIPTYIEGAGSIVGVLLALLLAMAGGAYALSVLFPGEPGAVIVRPASRTLTLVRHGLVANSEFTIPFGEVSRVTQASGTYRGGVGLTGVEFHTRNGDTWVIPAEVESADITDLRKVIGLRPAAR